MQLTDQLITDLIKKIDSLHSKIDSLCTPAGINIDEMATSLSAAIAAGDKARAKRIVKQYNERKR